VPPKTLGGHGHFHTHTPNTTTPKPTPTTHLRAPSDPTTQQTPTHKPASIAFRSHRSSTSRQMRTVSRLLLFNPAVASLDQVDRLANAVL
jgi:hypothetical protein